MADPRDRTGSVLASTTVNGVDFVEVTGPRALRVHFLNAVPVKDPKLKAAIDGGDSIPVVPLQAINNATDWSADAEGRPVLALTALTDGDFSTYRLTVSAPALDLILDAARFTFKVDCPSDFDCAPIPPPCPPDDTVVPPIDYLAKDFLSFRQALTEFSALRYPRWAERSEADLGMMLAEVLSALGDELSYTQDRVAAEAALPTATQRRSLVSLARLVDYEPIPAISAATQLQCDVAAGVTHIAAGTGVAASAPDGGAIPFEIGAGLADPTHYEVDTLWNFGIEPWWFDDTEQCRAAGATDLWVRGHGFHFTPGRTLLIQTDLPGESLRQIVRLTEPGHETFDTVFPTPNPVTHVVGPTPVTHLVWGTDEALTRARDLTKTKLGGNILPATQGRRVTESFVAGATSIARRGPNGTDANPNFVHRYPLGQAPLGWLAGDPPVPEIILSQAGETQGGEIWSFARWLLESSGTARDFTVDPVAWRAVSRTPTGVPTHHEIDGDNGDTIRFGNGIFGASPAEGNAFQVLYRTGLGSAGNVAADSITQIDPAATANLLAARNPFPVINGADAETPAHIRRVAPQAFRAVQFRAVRPEDYAAQAERLPWVRKAGTAFRWTGSWSTAFTAADPRGGQPIVLDRHIGLVELLNRRRLAGYESYAPPPRYISIDLRIEICVQPGWLDGDVEAAVLDRLGRATGTTATDGAGFFFADRFTFGTPLYRSRLEAVIQDVPGVAGVRSVTYRRRGVFSGFDDLPEAVVPASDQILRVDNDPSRPERGTIRVIPEGGR